MVVKINLELGRRFLKAEMVNVCDATHLNLMPSLNFILSCKLNFNYSEISLAKARLSISDIVEKLFQAIIQVNRYPIHLVKKQSHNNLQQIAGHDRTI